MEGYEAAVLQDRELKILRTSRKGACKLEYYSPTSCSGIRESGSHLSLEFPNGERQMMYIQFKGKHQY